MMDVYELTARVLWEITENQIKQWMKEAEAGDQDEEGLYKANTLCECAGFNDV